jgi:signal transduction histidine kinase
VPRIADDGPGFSAAALDRVFEPLFTSKGAKGTGLGLATVFTALREREAEGAVSAANAPEGGAVVECWLPVHEAAG